MATIYALKPAFQALLRPTVSRLAGTGVTANGVTTAAMALSVGWGALIAVTGGAAFALLGLPVVLLVRMALNAVDGMLAREHGQESRLGFFLNEIGDVVSDAALYLPLMLVLAPSAPLLAGAAVVAMALTRHDRVCVRVRDMPIRSRMDGVRERDRERERERDRWMARMDGWAAAAAAAMRRRRQP